MRICPDCQSPVDDQAVFCDNCGLPLSETGMAALAGSGLPPSATGMGEAAPTAFAGAGVLNAPAGTCSACGYQNVLGEMFCQNCGVQLAPVASSPPPPPVPSSGSSQDSSAAARPALPAGTCPHCGYHNQNQSPFCENCGVQLEAVDESTMPTSPSLPPVAQPTWQQEHEQQSEETGRLLVRASGAEIRLPSGRTDLLLGRTDPARQVYPDIDLTPHGGERNGVSRVHARLLIYGQQVSIEDLNSTNYTFINDQKLQPGQQYPLKDGDEVRLGLLVLFFFKT